MSEVFSRKPTTREEWYASPDFVILRLLNNLASELGHKAQAVRDVYNLIIALRPDISWMDKFSLVERQLKIVNLEASNLWDRIRDLEKILSPSEFTDMVFTEATKDSHSTTTQTQQDQHQD